jgi:hypothetical protein
MSLNLRERLKPIGGCPGLLLLAAAAAVLAVVARLDWPTYRKLQAQGIQGEGIVTGKGIAGPLKVSYTFAADGRLHSGVGRGGYGNPEFPDLTVGDKVLLFYLPQDPEVSVLGDPKEHLRDQNRVLVLMAAFVPLVMVVLVRRELKRWGP